MLTNVAQATALSDVQTAICRRWLAIDAERSRLQLEWGRLEGWLMTKRNWYRLTPEQQAEIPEGARLPEIDARLDLLWDEAGELLEAIRPARATSIEAVAAKLAVVARLVLKDDHPEAHDMITRAVKDLTALSRRR